MSSCNCVIDYHIRCFCSSVSNVAIHTHHRLVPYMYATQNTTKEIKCNDVSSSCLFDYNVLTGKNLYILLLLSGDVFTGSGLCVSCMYMYPYMIRTS